jgi:hypothetical protein
MPSLGRVSRQLNVELRKSQSTASSFQFTRREMLDADSTIAGRLVELALHFEPTAEPALLDTAGAMPVRK